jgi:limonene-1,2-epoxide hydrolase
MSLSADVALTWGRPVESEAPMPWFPDFASAIELARRQTRAAGRADPVGRYLASLTAGDAPALEAVWPGDVMVYDPRAGKVSGHRRLRRFIRDNQQWLAARHVRVEPIAATCVGGRAVVEVLAHLDLGGRTAAWPVAVVAESIGPESVEFRTYCSQQVVDGRRHVRPAFLVAGPAAVPGDVVGRHVAALAAGDVEATVGTFAPDGYLREPVGAPDIHRGVDRLHAVFSRWLGGGGIEWAACAVTDDGMRCGVEYNCARWGGRDLPPQAGLAVFERDRRGLLAGVRIYDDIAPPAGSG